QRLEEQREVRAHPRPRHLHLPRPILRADHARHARGQVRLVLEEIQMPPRVALGVMHLAARRAALRTCEPSALPKVDPQIQTTPPRIELDINDLPRLLKTKRLAKQA